ncbi:MAG: (d)CMP kinase [Candidatus Omnitrophica bacterium]|nr:(d)CMP kinase [Candidatus Omnitrophota bacterium]
MIIAVDGPAGAGKSTVAKLLAKRLGFLYIDTGAMYRALTLKVIENAIEPSDTERVIEVARSTRIELVPTVDGPATVLLDGRDVSRAIREPRITQSVSIIAKISRVREVMVAIQRSLGNTQSCVLDGRDIGTVVFPRADKKFFIDAAFDERVRRRHQDLINLGVIGVSKDAVAADLANRDTIDSTRKVAPLKVADDALVIDTTAMTIEQVVARMFEYTRQ